MLWPSFCTFSPGPFKASVDAFAPVAQKRTWVRTSRLISATRLTTIATGVRPRILS